LSLPSQYNWSNGNWGDFTHVYSGGIYRCWRTDTWGCKSYADIIVPESGESYFWRFPQGCAKYCEAELPKIINPPHLIPFDAWEYLMGGSTMPFNGPYSPSGTFSPFEPFWVDVSTAGNPNEVYQWSLTNDVCTKISKPWNLETSPCCDFKVDVTASCESSNVYSHEYTISLLIDWTSGSGCLVGNVNVGLVDINNNPLPNTYSLNPWPLAYPITSGNPASPVDVMLGSNITSYQGATIYLLVTIICGSEKCLVKVPVTFPTCVAKPANPDPVTHALVPEAFTIYPNPTNDVFNLKYAFEDDHNRILEIHDMTGRIILSETLTGKTGMFTLQGMNWASGVYLASIQGGSHAIPSKRFVVQHD